ncbi:MAG TPA: GIDE domain-containing protein, partial [Myxococcota bacterium]|nr:GIDE domain-containing protein [Myxococcota bacterium]
LRQGMRARVRGTIAGSDGLLTAPLSGRRVAWYRATVSEHRKHGKRSHWHTIIEEERGQDFLLQDATGQCKIRMDRARVASNTDAATRSGTFDDPSPDEQAFLDRYRRSSTGLFGLNRQLRYAEQVLEEGEAVTVLGRVTDTGADSFGPSVAELGADPELGLLVSDDPGTVRS